MVEIVGGGVGLHDAAGGLGGDGTDRNSGELAERDGNGGVDEGGRLVVDREGLCKGCGVPRPGGRGLELATDIDQEAAGGGVTAGAGVVIESGLVGAAVVVDDRRAEVEAVAQRGAADAALHGVDRLDAGVTFMGAAGALLVGLQLVLERLVDALRV